MLSNVWILQAAKTMPERDLVLLIDVRERLGLSSVATGFLKKYWDFMARSLFATFVEQFPGAEVGYIKPT